MRKTEQMDLYGISSIHSCGCNLKLSLNEFSLENRELSH